MIPISRSSSSITGRRLTPSSIIIVAASVTGRLGPMVSAGADIASPTVLAASLSSMPVGGHGEQPVEEALPLLRAALLEEDVALREHTKDTALVVHDGQAGDPVLGEQRRGVLQQECSTRTVSTFLVIRSLTLMFDLLGRARSARRSRHRAPVRAGGHRASVPPTGRR